jgi:hypothetical protein
MFYLTVRARARRLSGLRVPHSKSISYGVSVWARRALNRQKTALFRPGQPTTRDDGALRVIPGSHTAAAQAEPGRRQPRALQPSRARLH